MDLTPLFSNTVNSSDLAAHVHYAADLGMAGILYPWAVSRSREECDAVKSAIWERNLECSCIVYSTFDVLQMPLWVDSSRTASKRLGQEIRNAAAIANSLNSKVLAVLIKGNGDQDRAKQYACAVKNLRAMAQIGTDHGVTIGIEPLTAIPNMFLHNVLQARDLIAEVDNPAVGLIFDTGHVQMMDQDVGHRFRECFEYVSLLQLADQPGRVEPGGGSIDFDSILADALRGGYAGLVDLEHGWSNPTSQGERDGLQLIRQLDMRARKVSF
jgi:hydroxypyruvate isomerase